MKECSRFLLLYFLTFDKEIPFRFDDGRILELSYAHNLLSEWCYFMNLSVRLIKIIMFSPKVLLFHFPRALILGLRHLTFIPINPYRLWQPDSVQLISHSTRIQRGIGPSPVEYKNKLKIYI